MGNRLQGKRDGLEITFSMNQDTKFFYFREHPLLVECPTPREREENNRDIECHKTNRVFGGAWLGILTTPK